MSVASSAIDDLAAFDDDMIALMTPAELAEYEQWLCNAAAERARESEDDYEQWLRLLFPTYFSQPFAGHHHHMWEWVWSIRLGVRPAYVEVDAWGRGGAKSTSAEAAAVALGALRRRRYGLYVCDLQRMADDHVANVASMLESKFLRLAYPEMGQPLLGAYGNQRSWTRNRLRCASGFTIDAYGLNTSPRGLKQEDARPDFIILDEFDAPDDNPAQIEAKIETITEGLLPTGADDLAVLVIQNFPNRDGVMPRLCGATKEPAEYLQPRRVSGPVPALENFSYEQLPDGMFRIVSGDPTWAGQDVERCQAQINLWGISAFRKEAQFDLDARAGGMFSHLVYQRCTMTEVRWDDITKVAVWCDPAVTDNDNSDSQGVQCDALAGDTVYRLRSWEERTTPVTAIKVAIAFALRFGTRKVGIETDQGGDTWKSVYKDAVEEVRRDLALIAAGEVLVDEPDLYVSTLTEVYDAELVFPMMSTPAQEKAGATKTSKAGRGQQMLGAYETTETQIVHVIGTHVLLERALNRFGKTKPFDLVDAAYWSLRDLIKFGQPASTSARKSAARQFANPRGGTMARRTVVR